MPDRDRVTIERKLERYLIGVIEDTSSTRKERADAARQLVQLRSDKTQRIQEAKPGNRHLMYSGPCLAGDNEGYMNESPFSNPRQ